MNHDLVNSKFFDGDNLDEYLNNYWLGIGDVRKISVQNKLTSSAWKDKNKVPELLVDLCRQPDYLHFFCRYVLNINLLPYQAVILNQLWTHSLPLLVGSRGSAKSLLLAIYTICRCVLHQGSKVVVVGNSLRQSMIIWNYIKTIYNQAPILQDIINRQEPARDLHTAYWNCGDSKALFLPIGTGETIRGIRATHILVDEIASINPEILETVIRGFAAVKSDGVYMNVVNAYKEAAAKDAGIVIAKNVNEIALDKLKCSTKLKDNQIILSGTASFQFNHFFKYFNYYNSVIQTGGDKKKLKELFPDRETDDVDPSQYTVIRIPYRYLPLGLMDSTILQQGKATMDQSIFNMEYEAIFPADSEGFFLASWLNAATCPTQTSGGAVNFFPKLKDPTGNPCVMGIDPASENDNFAINIIQLNGPYRGIVYQWTTNRKDFEKKRANNLINNTINDYNTFVIRQIRSLLKRFNIILIICDAGGGGVSVKEGLRDPDKCEEGETIILDMDDESSFNQNGLKLLRLIQFRDTNFRQEAHYGMRADITYKKLLFPNHDLAYIETQKEFNNDVIVGESLEDCSLEIVKCKTESTLIRHSATQNGTEKWDIPEIKGVNAEGGMISIKRDRFTSLLLANYGARQLEAKNKDDAVYHNNPVGAVFNRGQIGGPAGGIAPVNIISGNGGRKIMF